MKIERRRLEDLQLDPDNAREHDDANLEAIKSSLGKFGQRKPIVVADGVVIAGNGTMLAAQALGWKEIDTVSADDLDELERKAYAIADNRTAELAKWNQEKLAQALADITEIGDELGEASGFDHEAIVDLVSQELGEPAEIVEDEVPEVEEDTVTQPGDLWVLGDHRLLCGDSTLATDVYTLLRDEQPNMMVTDPPYGVEYDPTWRPGSNAHGRVLNDDRADWREAWQHFEGDVAYVWHGPLQTSVVYASLADSGFDLRYLLVWAKSQHTFGRGHYHSKYEPCWMAVRTGKTASWIGDAKQTTLWDIEKNRINDTGHGTQKPVECMARPIRNHDAKLIYDPFLGSGTTLIAAEQLGRKCYGLELSPTYCDVIVRRWQKLTGQRAVNEATGELFPE